MTIEAFKSVKEVNSIAELKALAATNLVKVIQQTEQPLAEDLLIYVITSAYEIGVLYGKRSAEL